MFYFSGLCRSLSGGLAAALLGLCDTASFAANTYTTQLLSRPAGFSSYSMYGNHAAAGGQVAGTASVEAYDRAYLWSAASPAGVSLHPSYCTASLLVASDGVRQGGFAYNPSAWTGPYHAFLWSGTAASATDLNPLGVDTSALADVSSTQQVGSGTGSLTGNAGHAFLWLGSASTAVDLHPLGGYSASSAMGTDGIRQAGVATRNGADHAIAWNSTAVSAIDLHPAVASTSIALDVAGTQQVGYSIIGGNLHASVWNNSATSFVDLNPNGFLNSTAYGTDGVAQVGTASTASASHAMLWYGTADSAVDLGALLGASFTESTAESIVGNTVYGVASDNRNRRYLVTWTVPEPASLPLAAVAGLIAFRRRAQGVRPPVISCRSRNGISHRL